MDAKKFTELWQSENSPLIKFQLKTDMAAGLSELTASILKNHGLPKTAEPWLNFMEFLIVDESVSDVLNGLNYYPIGYLANGDIICIDKADEKLMICDHEDMTYTWMLNSSLGALYDSLVLFRDFITEVNEKNPDYSRNFKIPDGMLDTLARDFKEADKESYENEGFWYTEIQALGD